jgi:hypothetical protein
MMKQHYIGKCIITFCNISLYLFIFMGCSGEGKDDANSEENKLKVSAPQQQEQNKQSGFDISKINVCELVPDELVAKTLGAQTLKPAQTSDYGSTQGCTYTLDPAGDDNIEVCTVWLNPPSTFTSPEDELETAKGLGQEATVENLEGLGDKAFVVHNKTEDQSIIFVLLKDKANLQVAVEHFDDAKKLTELILLQLKNLSL